MRLSGQDRLYLGWSQPQKELERELSWVRECCSNIGLTWRTNSKAKVTVKFSEQEVHRVRNNGEKCKEHRLFPPSCIPGAVNMCPVSHSLNNTLHLRDSDFASWSKHRKLSSQKF